MRVKRKKLIRKIIKEINENILDYSYRKFVLACGLIVVKQMDNLELLEWVNPKDRRKYTMM